MVLPHGKDAQIVVYVSSRDHERFKATCKNRSTTMNAVVRELIAEYLNRYPGLDTTRLEMEK